MITSIARPKIKLTFQSLTHNFQMFACPQSTRGLPEQAGEKAAKELCARLQQPNNQKHAQQSARQELWYKFLQEDQQGYPFQSLWMQMWTRIPSARNRSKSKKQIQEE